MFLLIPYHVDVPMRRWPWANWILIGLTIVFYPLCFSGNELSSLGHHLVLGGGSWFGYAGYVLIHADIFHLLGNMLFLWVFGNAVCAKVGNIAFPIIYFALGIASGVVSQLIDSRPTVGASGAINGVVGMFLVWYLWNDVTCWYGYCTITASTGSFSFSSIWLILLWLIFDIWGAIQGGGNVAYFAHLAGLALGFALATALLISRWIKMERGEVSLLQTLMGEEMPRPRKKKRRANESEDEQVRGREYEWEHGSE